MIAKKYDYRRWRKRAWDADCPECHGNGQSASCGACADTGLDPIPNAELFADTRRFDEPKLDEAGS